MKETHPAAQDSPDPAVLHDALKAVVDLYDLGSDRNLSWVVGRRVERRRSTLFPLRMTGDSGMSVGAVYKVVRPRGKVDLIKDALARSDQLTRTLARLCDGEGITAAPVLAADPAALTIVTLALPGRHLGVAIRHILTRRGRRAAVGVFRRIGRAMRLVEQTGEPHDANAYERLWAAIDRDIGRASGVFSQLDAVELARRLRELGEATIRDGVQVYCHGDFSPTNVLVTPDGIGLIDFEWLIRLRGFDVTCLACRVEYEALALRPWSSMLVGALLEGYGDPEIRGSASWQLYRLRRVIRTASRPPHGTRHRWIIERAREEMKAELNRR